MLEVPPDSFKTYVYLLIFLLNIICCQGHILQENAFACPKECIIEMMLTALKKHFIFYFYIENFKAFLSLVM